VPKMSGITTASRRYDMAAADTMAARRSARASRFEARLNSTDRAAAADPAWQVRKPTDKSSATSISMPMGRRRCTGGSDCTCKVCVLARWQASPPTGARVGVRLDGNSSWSSDDESVEEEELELTRSKSAPPFSGFSISSTLDLFEPASGVGPSLTLEARPLPDGGTEQTLTFDSGFKLSVQEITPASGALPETLLTVLATAAGRTSPEVLYSRRSNDGLRGLITRDRALSLDDLAARHGQPSRLSERGDASSAVAALERAARSYGTSAPELVEAVRSVAPPVMGASLAVICC